MKKSLIALSVLATVAASANAQSNISIYGIADAGFVYSKNGSGDNVTAIGSGVQSGSRLGFRGAEDIGGGTKAIFTLEQGYNINDGTQGQGRLFGRQSFVGILLAVARTAGETAPLLFTALNNQFFSASMNQPMANLPVVIFQFAMSPYDNWRHLAWGGALLVTFGVLGLNILSRSIFKKEHQG
jgi:hypothetical protein